MRVQGKYTVNIKENGLVVNTIETHNIVVDGGLQHITDWFMSSVMTGSNMPGFKEIDTTGMTVSSAGFTNDTNAVDGSESSYTGATIDSGSWDNDWWRIDFGEEKDIMAIYVNWAEDDSNRGADYKFQYSSDGASWTDIPVRLRPPQESNVRGKVMFFVDDNSEHNPITTRYIRLNTKRGDDNETFSLYEIKFYEPAYTPMAPGVMALGDGAMSPPPSGGETGLRSMVLAKPAVVAVQPSGFITRYVMSLDGDEANGINFTEAGMMYSDDGYKIPASGNSPNLFSRGIFPPSGWTKMNGQTADVYYEISVGND